MSNYDVQLKQLAAEFDEAWRDGSRPILKMFLDRVDQKSQLRLAELLIPIDVEYRLRQGQQINLVDYPGLNNKNEPIGRLLLRCLPVQNAGTGSHDEIEATLDSTAVQHLSHEIDTTRDSKAVSSSQDDEGLATCAKPEKPIGESQTIGHYKLLQKLGEGGMGTVWMAEQKTAEVIIERQKSEADARQANLSAKRTADVLQIVTDAFESIDPNFGGKTDLEVKDVLFKAKASLESSSLDREGKLLLLRTLTTCFLGIGEYEAAVETGELDVALSGSIENGDDRRTLVSKNILANAYFTVGKLKNARKLHEEVLVERKRFLGDEHSDTLDSMQNLAMIQVESGSTTDIENAVSLLEHVVVSRKRRNGLQNSRTLEVMGELGIAYRMNRQTDKSIEMLRQTFENQSKSLESDHPSILNTMHNLSLAYSDADLLDDSFALDQRVLALRESRLGSEHPDTLRSMGRVATGLLNSGKIDQATEILTKTVAIQKRVLRSGHPDQLTSMANLAVALAMSQKFDAAIDLMKPAYDTQVITLGAMHSDTLKGMYNLGKFYYKSKQVTKAIEFYKRNLEEIAGTFGIEHPESIKVIKFLAAAINHNVWAKVAQPTQQELEDLSTAELDDMRWACLQLPDSSYLNTLATAEYRFGNFQEAITASLKSMKLLPPEGERFDSSFAGDLAILAMCHFRLGEIEKANEYRQQLAESMKQDAYKNDEAC